MSQAEFDFYAARSGLPATATLTEHQRAFWAAGGPVASPELLRLFELEVAYYRAKLPDDTPQEALDGLRTRYFAGRSGLPAGNAVRDHMQAFFTMAAVPLTQILATADKPWPSTQPVGTSVTVSCTYTGWPNPETLILFRRVNGGAFAQLSQIPASSGHGGQFPAVTLNGVAADVIDLEVRGNGGAVVSNRLTYTLS